MLGTTIRARTPIGMCVNPQRLIDGEWRVVRARWINIYRGIACELGPHGVFDPHIVRGRYRVVLSITSDTVDERRTFDVFKKRMFDLGCLVGHDFIETPRPLTATEQTEDEAHGREAGDTTGSGERRAEGAETSGEERS